VYDEISDHRLLYWYQNQLRKPEYNIDRLKNIRLCGHGVVHMPAQQAGAFLLSNGEKSRFFGVAKCRNSWACPVCSAEVMAKQGTRIACAIDALSKWYNQDCFMTTFTLPHTSHMSAQDTFTILKKTWRYFAKDPQGARKRTETRTNKKGQTHVYSYVKGQNPYGLFREQLNITYFVKVYEFTWGENSWHPHIHALFWVPKKNWSKIPNYEESLLERWWQCAKKSALEYYNSKRPDKLNENRAFVDNLFVEWRKYPKTGHRSLYMSKNKDGSIRKQKSSFYLSGWSGDTELTGTSIKQARNGHYTPHQILEKAYELRQTDDYKFWLNLYVEFNLAIRCSRRVDWSVIKNEKSFHEIIEAWQRTNQYTEVLKKKATAKAAWHVVCWFPEQQWLLLCLRERVNPSIRTTLLQLAKEFNARELISQYLEQFDIKLQDKPHPMQSLIENQIFNKLAS